MAAIRIWYQSYVDEAHGRTYWDRLRAHLAALADTGTEIDIHGITPHDSYPHRVMEWRCAREMMVNAVTAEKQGCDAFIVGHFQDAGLHEARSMVDIPVLGLGETTMLHACTLAQRLALVTFKPAYIPWFRQQVARYRLDGRISGIHAVDVPGAFYNAALESAAANGPLYDHFRAAVEPLVRDGAEAIIPTGGGPMMVLSGLGRVQEAPVLDGTAITLKAAEMAVKLKRATGLGASRVGEFTKAPPHVVEEFITHPKGL